MFWIKRSVSLKMEEVFVSLSVGWRVLGIRWFLFNEGNEAYSYISVIPLFCPKPPPNSSPQEGTVCMPLRGSASQPTYYPWACSPDTNTWRASSADPSPCYSIHTSQVWPTESFVFLTLVQFSRKLLSWSFLSVSLIIGVTLWADDSGSEPGLPRDLAPVQGRA